MQIEAMIKDEKNEVPEFRAKALEEEFCQKMSYICEVFKLYGENKIEEHYDIR